MILLSSFSISEIVSSQNNTSSLTTTTKPVNEKAALRQFSEMKVKDFEKLTRKKMSLKQKITFKILQQKIKKALKKDGETQLKSKGQTAFILSLIGLGILFVPYASLAAIPLAVIAIVKGSQAKKENPKDKKAKTAILLGSITLGLFVFILIFALIWIASWRFLF